MRKNESKPAPQGARLSVVAGIVIFAILTLLVLVCLLPKGPKPGGTTVEVIDAPSLAVESVRPVRHSLISRQVKTEEEPAPETELALAQFGLSAKSVVPISVAAQALPPVVLPKMSPNTNAVNQ